MRIKVDVTLICYYCALWFSPGFIGFAHHHFTKFASCNLLNQSVSSSSFSIRSMLRECSGNFFPRRFG